MVTRGQSIDGLQHVEQALAAADAALRQGEVVVVPTESFYGLAVRADDAAAVARLCVLKGRAPDKPLPLVAAHAQAVHQWCTMPAALQPLAQHFWPGPLTLALPSQTPFPKAVFAGGTSLGVRVSAHPFLRALAQRAGTLITATSANLSGDPPVTTLNALHPSLRRAVLAIDGGTLPGGMPSTVVGLTRLGRLTVLRPGAISQTALANAAGSALWL